VSWKKLLIGRVNGSYLLKKSPAICGSSSKSHSQGFCYLNIKVTIQSVCFNDATGLLERLLKAADEGGRMGSVIEILILQALAHQMQEDIPAALTSLERALKLAEPEGYMRIFLAEGSSMAELIREIDSRGILPNYTRKLLSAFEVERSRLGCRNASFRRTSFIVPDRGAQSA
jgi:hypothetical protein